MRKLLNLPDFDELPRLQKLIISQCDELVEIHSSLGRHGSLKYISVSCCPKFRSFPTIVHMENLKSLEIGYCNLEDGDIPSGIDRLSNLQELSLRGNKFSRLDFSLLQLTRLKLLNISGCEQLLELPQLPSGLVILKADSCKSVTTTGDCHKNCKQLRHVSLIDVIINDADRLLKSMLEVKSIENGCMLLQLEGVEIAKGFTPLLRGKTCSLQLPEKWYDDFCGFLICVVLYRGDHLDINIRARVMSGMDYQSDVVWEERHSNSMKEAVREGDNDNHQTYKTRSQFLEENDCDKHLRTWVTYVSFGSLRYAARWVQTYKAISFEVDADGCHSFGVRLVDKKSKGV
ncbi:putative leucine-rich repeat domain superfamily [Helianthus annuus]|uniref:Leucine-rich repeat domain superfamily n=1 Tax=Helianthus annuus TaxID=4232 RepID=A0A9K3J3X1_HELAN|nr:TMV resistance protein N-like [Helianthus annuus]KAF5808008.1 putative leucine-rich repeat domain superfamily [Helianthus annuus]KAJ0929343.1 putative leucine-rich repeat domain superfamily [Helianthus annuus]